MEAYTNTIYNLNPGIIHFYKVIHIIFVYNESWGEKSSQIYTLFNIIISFIPCINIKNIYYNNCGGSNISEDNNDKVMKIMKKMLIMMIL